MWSLIFDFLVLTLLAVTIVFTARLSIHLKTFRESHNNLGSLIGELSGAINRAQQAMGGLQDSAQRNEAALQDTIGEAGSLIEELQLMIESGNSLASRLEKLAEQGSKAATPAAPVFPSYEEAELTHYRQDQPDESGFAIRDPEFLTPGESSAPRQKQEKPDAPLHSLAERELFEALRGRRKKAGSGG